MTRRPPRGDDDRQQNTRGDGSGGRSEMDNAMNHDSEHLTTEPDDGLDLEGDLEAMAKRMQAGATAEPPAHLEDALLEDLHQALAGDGARTEGGAVSDEPTESDVGRPPDLIVGSWQRWSRSPALRAAAALIVLVGLSALLVRGGFFQEGTDRRSPAALSDEGVERQPAGERTRMRSGGQPEAVGSYASAASGTDGEVEETPARVTPGRADGPSETSRPDAAMSSAQGSGVQKSPPQRAAREISRLEPGRPQRELRQAPNPAVRPRSEAPLLNESDLGQGAQVELEKIPTARDPWSGVDRDANRPGSDRRDGRRVEGVDMTDMRAAKEGPTLHDFDQTADSGAALPAATEVRVADDSAESKKLEALGYVGSNDRRQRSRGALEERIRENAPAPREGRASALEDSIAEAEPAIDSDRRIFDEERVREVPTHPRVRIDQFDAMTFKDYGISPFVDTERDAQSTFGLEVDTGSFNLARRYLDAGALPPPEAVRVEEMVNALDYRDASPRRDDFQISVEGTVSPFDRERLLLRVGVKARELDRRERPPVALTFLIDTSGSMNRENRLGLVQKSLEYLIDQLEPGDTVAIVTYGSNGRVELEPTGDRERIRTVVRSLRPGGSTNLEEGLALAYEIAGRRARGGVVSRVILCSDGVANVGLTDPEGLLRSVAVWGARGVELTAVGVGLGNYNDEMLERLADRGDGRYAYVDRLDEARRLFVEDLTGTLFTVGKDARVQVTFDADQVAFYRLIGYENRAIADHRFRDRRTDGGEIGAGHAVTALYELELRGAAAAPGWFDRLRGETLGEVALVYRAVGGAGPESELTERSVPIRARDFASRFDRAPASLRLATVAARFAEVLRVSPHVHGDLSELFEMAQDLVPEFRGDRRLVQLVDMIGVARDLLRKRD